MRKFFTRIVFALRNTEWIVSLHRSLSEAEWVASTVQWFGGLARHVWATVAVVTGLGVAGIIGVVRALDSDLIFQWVVGAVWVALCVFIGHRVNKKIESWTPKEEKKAVRERAGVAVSIPTTIRPAESAKVPNPSEPAGSEMTDDDDREEANPSGLWPLLRFFCQAQPPIIAEIIRP